MEFTMVNNNMSKNKDQKSLESIYESIRFVRENEEPMDEFEGGASFEGEGRDLGSIDGETPEISDVEHGEEGEDEDDAEGISREELDAILNSLNEPSEDVGEAPEDVQDDFREEDL
jgi:hypothetical protein